MKWLLVLVCSVLYITSFCFEILSPEENKGFCRSTIYNEAFGRQDGENLNITAPIIFLQSKVVCKEENMAKYKDHIVLVEVETAKLISVSAKFSKCVEDGGGLASVVITPD